jgi:hypothetical protein
MPPEIVNEALFGTVASFKAKEALLSPPEIFVFSKTAGPQVPN